MLSGSNDFPYWTFLLYGVLLNTSAIGMLLLLRLTRTRVWAVAGLALNLYYLGSAEEDPGRKKTILLCSTMIIAILLNFYWPYWVGGNMEQLYSCIANIPP